MESACQRHADYTRSRLQRLAEKAAGADLKALAQQLEVGEPTLRDIVRELAKPGRDPREDLPKPVLRTDVLDIISWREIYDCLEACADACEHVADTIETIVMKNVMTIECRDGMVILTDLMERTVAIEGQLVSANLVDGYVIVKEN